VRRGFHVPGERNGRHPAVTVQRYRCLNPDCPRCTFSVLPPKAIRYCRFCWSHLLQLRQLLNIGTSKCYLARMWQVGRAVIQRAASLLAKLGSWTLELHRELTDGGAAQGLACMVSVIIRSIGRLELAHRWYLCCYPLRANLQKAAYTIQG
jgi:hypothetical protein